MPNTATGLLTAFGTVDESTYGTAVARDKWIEILTDSLQLNEVTLQSNGLRSQTITGRRGSRRARTRRDVTGTVSMEVPTTGFGRILKHIYGGTPTIAQQGGTAAWLQTHAYGSVAGKSLCLESHRRDSANALIQHFVRTGCKIPDAEFSVSKDQILIASLTIDGQDESVSSSGAYAAGTPSYANNNVFNWTQGALTLAGVALAKVTDVKFKITRPMKVDTYFIGGGGLKSEPTENDYPTITGSVTLEFDSAAKTKIYDAYAADTALALVLTFTGANISGIYNQSLVFTFPEVHLLGETPKVGGPDVVMVSPNFEAAYDGTNAFSTATLISTDTTIT